MDSMDAKALIILAEMLNKARIQANAIDATASQDGVYGEIVTSLKRTLAILTDDAHTASRVYENLLNCSSVKEALEVTSK